MQLSLLLASGGISGIQSPSTVFKNFDTLPQDLVNRFLIFASAFAGLFFFVRLVMAGYLYLTSAGDPNKVQSATKSFINAALGLFIVVTGYFLAGLIFKILGVGGIV